jgi:hypothetical protein
MSAKFTLDANPYYCAPQPLYLTVVPMNRPAIRSDSPILSACHFKPDLNTSFLCHTSVPST